MLHEIIAVSCCELIDKCLPLVSIFPLGVIIAISGRSVLSISLSLSFFQEWPPNWSAFKGWWRRRRFLAAREKYDALHCLELKRMQVVALMAD